MEDTGGGGGVTREQLLLYVKKQKETIKKLTDENAALSKAVAGEALCAAELWAQTFPPH